MPSTEGMPEGSRLRWLYPIADPGQHRAAV